MGHLEGSPRGWEGRLHTGSHGRSLRGLAWPGLSAREPDTGLGFSEPTCAGGQGQEAGLGVESRGRDNRKAIPRISSGVPPGRVCVGLEPVGPGP